MAEEEDGAMSDPLKPSPALLSKLGSLVVHADEYLDAAGKGHPFDKNAFDALLAEPEVAEWMAAMGKLAMIPLKRSGRK
jgi:hypothetical protein